MPGVGGVKLALLGRGWGVLRAVVVVLVVGVCGGAPSFGGVGWLGFGLVGCLWWG